MMKNNDNGPYIGSEEGELLKAVLETVVDGILTIDEEGSIITANPAVERIFGYAPHELVGENVKKLMPSPYHEEHDGYLVNYLETGNRKIIGIGREVSGQRKDGTVFPMELAVGETRTEQGHIFTGIVRDISERKKAEEDLRRERALLRAVVDTAVDGILTIDEQGTIVTANPATASLFGYSTEELIGRNVRMLMPTPYHDEHDGYLSNYLRTGDRKVIGIGREVRGLRKNGEEFPLDLSVSETRTDGGRIFTGIVRDISERKRSDELTYAKEIAERANVAKSEFLSRMSHEFRTPMNAILGFGQLLELTKLDERQSDNVRQILRGGRHLLGLINDVLDISRIEIGALGVSLERVVFGDVLSESISLMRSTLSQRDIKLEVKETSSFHVVADRQRLRQVVLNLLSNAIKYNVKGGMVSVRTLADGDECVIVEVEDTGIGISTALQEKLFTPFERLGVEVRGIEGTGLGLLLSKALTEAMGGTLTFVSKEGEGSCFRLVLARSEGAAVMDNFEVTPAIPEGDPASRTIQVLLIEDNLTNTELLAQVFAQRPHFQLLSTMQGRLGLELAAKHKPDLILLDLHLPDMTGRDVLLALRSDPELRSVPVIVVSADAFNSQSKALMDAGAFRYVTKPFVLAELMTAVDDALKENH